MLRRASAIAALLLAAATGSGAAQENRSVGYDAEHFFRDIAYVWTAPLHAHGEDLEGVALTAGLVGGALLIDQAVMDWIRAHPDALPVRFLGLVREDSPGNLAGRTFVLVPTSVALYLIGLIADSHALRDAGAGCLASNVSTTLSRFTLSNLIGRLRPSYERGPFVIEPLAFGDWPMRSFPGGHAANIMTCVSYWNHRFDMGVAEPLLWTLAGTVGMARVADEAHWLSDTLFGMAYGLAVGKTVAARMRNRAEERALDAAGAPTLYLGWSVKF